MSSIVKTLIARFRLLAYRMGTIRDVCGYGDVNIDSSAPGRHTPGN
jgi:hypothetical protein